MKEEVSESVIAAIKRAASTPEGYQRVSDMIGVVDLLLEAAHTRLRSADGAPLFRTQGAALVLRDISTMMQHCIQRAF